MKWGACRASCSVMESQKEGGVGGWEAPGSQRFLSQIPISVWQLPLSEHLLNAQGLP